MGSIPKLHSVSYPVDQGENSEYQSGDVTLTQAYYHLASIGRMYSISERIAPTITMGSQNRWQNHRTAARSCCLRPVAHNDTKVISNQKPIEMSQLRTSKLANHDSPATTDVAKAGVMTPNQTNTFDKYKRNITPLTKTAQAVARDRTELAKRLEIEIPTPIDRQVAHVQNNVSVSKSTVIGQSYVNSSPITFLSLRQICLGECTK